MPDTSYASCGDLSLAYQVSDADTTPAVATEANQVCSVCRDTPTFSATCDTDKPSLITADTA